MQYTKGEVIVVNEQDEWLGTMEKIAAHRQGTLHRAFSIFILNEKRELLLQQRAAGKYHSGGLWSNTCCSHPIPHESTLAAAHRRLQEEMGFDCELQPVFNLRYNADVGNGFIENELDHVYIGQYDGIIKPDAEEVSDYKYVSISGLKADIAAHSEKYTAWLRLALPEWILHLPPVKHNA